VLSSSENNPASLAPADPRVVIVAQAALIAAALFAAGSTGAILVLLAWAVAVVAAFAGGSSALAAHARRLWPFAAVIVVLNGLVVPGAPLLEVFGRRVLSVPGVRAGVFFSLRLAVMYLALAAMLRMHSPRGLARGAAGLVRPFSHSAAAKVSFHAFLAMSFVPFFADEWHRIRLAQSFRGGGFTGRFMERVHSVPPVVVPLVLSAIRRSEQLAMVVELRGLRARLAATGALPRPGLRDAAFAIATAAVVWLSLAAA
jgi:energy-coupling factor transport system permease protein